MIIRKKILSFIISIIFIFSSQIGAYPITMKGDTLMIPKTSVPPTIDGNLDNVWYQVTKTRNLTYVQGTAPGKWTDSFYWFRVMWDDQNFYLFAEVFDDEINTTNNNTWERDGFEIYFDGNNSKGTSYDGVDDQQYRFIYGESTGNPGTANSKHSFKITDYGFNFELAIPMKDLKFNFKNNLIIGFDLQYNDNDGGSRQHVAKWWSSSDNNYQDPSLFGTAKLIATKIGNHLNISRSSTPPVIDGTMDNPWNNALEITNNKYILLSGSYTDFTNWNDLVFNYRVMWDDGNFYLFAKVLDNEINTSAQNNYEKDSFELYFDGDNSKNSQAQGYDSNDKHYSWIYNQTVNDAQIPNSQHAWLKTNDGFQFELKIPASDLPFQLTQNQIIGFELQLNDNDKGVRNKIAKWWSENDNSWQNPSLFGTAQLVGDGTEPVIESAKKPDFSVKRGFYEHAFDVELTSKTPNATIKYTLDGSDPVTSSTALQIASPVTIHIDPENTTGGRGKNPGVILRACATAAGFSVSKSETHTYLFVNKVSSLSSEGVKPGPGWPEPSGPYSQQYMDYGLDHDVLNDSRYKDLIDDALLAIPTISVSTDLKNLFDPITGIYMNALKEGSLWERPASAELMNPDGSEGFQINCGIRIRGGWSRHGDNPKHAFRLFFRGEYGNDKLNFKLFEDEGVDEFDKLDLRTSQNYSWSYKYDSGKYNTMNRDVFSRDLQREMGQPYTRSRYYHLYLDGVYWGLFQSQERSEARFAASYMGGNAEEYDVIKPGTDENYNRDIIATDGNMTAYASIWNMCQTGFTSNLNYFKLLGRNADGTRNSSLNVLVDVDNLIDFMLVIFYTGNFDSPTSKFGSDRMPNNFFCIYNRNNSNEGFKFFAHDAEHTLRTDGGEGPGIGINENRVTINNMYVSNINSFHPQWLHYKLTSNTEYKIKFADHVFKHFFNNGCLTPNKASLLFQKRADEIKMAIIAESARWGDAYYQPKRTKDDDWLWAVNDIVNNYFPKRSNIVLGQLKNANLYPSIDPPQFVNNSQETLTGFLNVEPGYKLKLRNPNNTKGTIYYTIDGSDPRAIGGSTASLALDGGDEIELIVNSTTIIKTRVKDGSTWSAINEITVFSNNSTSDLKVTEIHYHPLDGVNVSDNEYEFLEMKNIGNDPINLSNAVFTDGIDYTFPPGTVISPHEFIVLASNKIEFNNRYKFVPSGEYLGQLDNGGERITLVTALSDTIFSIRYNDKDPWPESPDTAGYSLVPKELNPTGDQNDPLNWRASYSVNGSPGQDDISTDIETTTDELPNSFKLEQNYPNPFNPITTIEFSIPVETKYASSLQYVTLKVYDILGREIAELINEEKMPGNYEVTFDGNGLASGIYFYRLQSGSFNKTKKFVLMK